MSYYYTAQPYSNPVDLESLLSLLQQQQLRSPQSPSRSLQTYPHYYTPTQQQQNYHRRHHNQPRNSRPRVIQKLETEDEYQIQIHKSYGNFNNYEVKVIKLQPPLIKIVISSQQDDFQIDFNFNVNYIDIENINWRWYKQDNILSLNIPKKLHYIHSNLNDVINCLLGGGNSQLQLYLEHEPEQEEGEEDYNSDGSDDDDDSYSSLDEHEKLVQEAIDALIEKKRNKKKQTQKGDKVSNANGEKALSDGVSKEEKQKHHEAFEKQKQLAQDAIISVLEKKKKQIEKEEEEERKAKEEEERKAKEEEEKKAKEEEAKKKAAAEEEARKKAAAAAAAEVEAKKKAASESKRKADLEKARKEFALKQEQERQKILQAQQELEKLAKLQEELEKQHESDSAVTTKEDELKLEITKEEDKYQQNSDEYEAYLKQQQDLLNQFFGFNLGPLFTSSFAPPPVQEKQKQATPASNGSSLEAKKQDPKPSSSNKSEPTKQKQQFKSPKGSTSTKNKSVTPAAPTPVHKILNGTATNDKPLRKLHSPSLEDVEDEESILFRKKFDH